MPRGTKENIKKKNTTRKTKNKEKDIDAQKIINLVLMKK